MVSENLGDIGENLFVVLVLLGKIVRFEIKVMFIVVMIVGVYRNNLFIVGEYLLY